MNLPIFSDKSNKVSKNEQEHKCIIVIKRLTIIDIDKKTTKPTIKKIKKNN